MRGRAAKRSEYQAGLTQPGNPAVVIPEDGRPEALRPRFSLGCAMVVPIYTQNFPMAMECVAFRKLSLLPDRPVAADYSLVPDW